MSASTEFSPVVADLVRLLGRRKAVALCRAGRLIYVPMKLRPGTRLVQMIGPQDTAKLQAHFGCGRHVMLPKLSALDRAKRNAEIKRLGDEGVTRPQIAARYGLTVRQVGNILRA